MSNINPGLTEQVYPWRVDLFHEITRKVVRIIGFLLTRREKTAIMTEEKSYLIIRLDGGPTSSLHPKSSQLTNSMPSVRKTTSPPVKSLHMFGWFRPWIDPSSYLYRYSLIHGAWNVMIFEITVDAPRGTAQMPICSGGNYTRPKAKEFGET